MDDYLENAAWLRFKQRMKDSGKLVPTRAIEPQRECKRTKRKNVEFSPSIYFCIWLDELNSVRRAFDQVADQVADKCGRPGCVSGTDSETQQFSRTGEGPGTDREIHQTVGLASSAFP